MKKFIFLLLLTMIEVGIQAKVSVFVVKPKCEYTSDTSSGITKVIDSPIKYISVDDDCNVFFYDDNRRWEDVLITKTPEYNDYKHIITYWRIGTLSDKVAMFDYTNNKIIFGKFKDRELTESWIFQIDIEASKRLK
ncbi:MAG: hypothetical protein ACI3Y0_11265 [Prevotella sp.]